jgi:hypothetical protein
MLHRYIYSWFLVLTLAIVAIGAYAPGVRPDHQLDIFMLQLATRYGIPLPALYYCQPMNTATVMRFLEKADSLGSTGILTHRESLQLVQLKRRMSPSGFLAGWTEKSGQRTIGINVSLLGDVNPRYAGEGSVGARGIISPSLSANAGAVSLYSGIDVWTEYRSDSLFPRSSYQPFDGVPYNLYGRSTVESSVRSSDLPRGGIRYDMENISVETAIDYLKIGPALYYPLTLSGTAPPVTWFRGTIGLGPVDYFHAAGLLRAQKDRSKYIYVHRLHTSLWNKRIQAGINEVIINGSTTEALDTIDRSNRLRPAFYNEERSWEWVYLIPFVPFKFAEHYVGDRDNAAVSVDGSLFWPGGFRWYAEFFLDDISSPWKLFNNDWGNKWALTAGVNYTRVLWNRGMHFDFEYSHVEPWVYTHFHGGSHNYTHFGMPLGSPLGPNSQAFHAAVRAEINKYNEAGLSFRAEAKNGKVRGGSITDVFQDTIWGADFQDRTTKEFLGAGTVWTAGPGCQWVFNPFGLFRLVADYRFDITTTNSIISLQGGLVF